MRQFKNRKKPVWVKLLRLCLVAAGKAKIYVNTSGQTGEWDACAPDIILQKAGGKITDLHRKN